MVVLSELKWSEMIPMESDNRYRVPDNPGVYRWRLIDAEGKLVPVLRNGRLWDEEGILYIGGTPRSGMLRGRFVMMFHAHRKGKTQFIEPTTGEVAGLWPFWKDVWGLYPDANMSFEFAVVESHAAAGYVESLLHHEYMARFVEDAASGRANSLFHNPRHPWRQYLTREAQR